MGFDLYRHAYGEDRKTRLRAFTCELEETEGLAVAKPTSSGVALASVRGFNAEVISEEPVKEGLVWLDKLMIASYYTRASGMPVEPLPLYYVLKSERAGTVYSAELSGKILYLLRSAEQTFTMILAGDEVREVIVPKRVLSRMRNFKELSLAND